MENQIFKKKAFIKELKSLLSKIIIALKESTNQQKEDNKELFKKYQLIFDISKKGILKIKKDLPPTSDLDALFEIVIEKSKIADTKPTIEIGVKKSQIKTVPGKNLGMPASNQKVILEFY